MSTGIQRSYVSAGSLLCYSAQASTSFESDTLVSQLVMQLNASIKHDPFSDRAAWLDTCRGVMGTFGYLPLYNETQSVTIKGPKSIWDLISDKLHNRVSATMLEQAQHAWINLQADRNALDLLRKFSVKSPNVQGDRSVGLPLDVQAPSTAEGVAHKDSEVLSAVALQLVFVDKEPLLTQVFISFKTACPVGDLPCIQTVTQDQVVGNLEVAITTSQLDEYHYGLYRDGLVNKLGARRVELVIELNERGV